MEEFFMKLFSQPHAGKRYFNVAAYLQTGQTYHLFGQISYIHRLAHIQHKDLPAMADGPGL